MIRSKLMFCAEIILRDVETNNVSAISLLTNIEVPGFPFLLTRCGVFNLLERAKDDPSEIQVQVIAKQNGTTILAEPLDINFGERLFYQNILNLSGVIFETPGNLEISILMDDQVLADYEFTIHPILTVNPQNVEAE